MTRADVLDEVRAEDVEFVTTRPPGSTAAVLDRRVIVTGPPALAELSRTSDVDVLDELVERLRDPDTAWAAEVVLAAMTRRDEKQVEAFATQPGEWWEALGRDAHERWASWLRDCRERLRWDADSTSFTVA